jgi:MinD superfamily P-loop ATPase
MPFKIAIVSGKGGTGKTTIAVNLFHFFIRNQSGRIQLVDCDVEEPNVLIFFPEAKKIDDEIIFQLIPEINSDKCNFCRKCAEYCEFNAIVVIPQVQFAQINASLCHSCGACLMACNKNAVTEIPHPVGMVNFYELREGCRVSEGKLRIGSARQTMLIRELKKRIPDDNDIIIYDAPPGTSCPVVETMSDADYVVIVAESTLFGLHDLRIMTDLLTEIKKSFGVLVNKAGLGDHSIHRYLEKQGIDIIGEIPFNQEYASNYAKGRLFDKIPEKISMGYARMEEKLEKLILAYERDNSSKW